MRTVACPTRVTPSVAAAPSCANTMSGASLGRLDTTGVGVVAQATEKTRDRSAILFIGSPEIGVVGTIEAAVVPDAWVVVVDGEVVDLPAEALLGAAALR